MAFSNRYASVTFHHLAGTFPSATGDTSAVQDSVVELFMEDNTDKFTPLSERWEKMLFTTKDNPSRVLNNKGVKDTPNWFFERVRIPQASEWGRRMTLQAKFDPLYGAFGADNIKLHTSQK